MGARIEQCEVYPEAFCELVCREVLTERAEASDGANDRHVTAEINVLMSLEAMSVGALSSPHEEEDRGIWAEEFYSDKEFYDDVTGTGFNRTLTVKARELEMKFIRDRGIYTQVMRSEWLQGDVHQVA